MKLFWIAVVRHPTPAGVEEGVEPEIVVQPRVVMANDEKHASMEAGRGIKDTGVGRLEVAVSPF